MDSNLRGRVAAIVFALSGAGLAIINPRFTPRHLVDEAELVLAGPLQATGSPLEWQFTAATPIKGKAAASHVVSLAECSKDHLGDIQQTLKLNAKDPAILFSGMLGQEKRAFLHVAGVWLDVKAAGGARWSVAGYASQMTGTYVGGTDMLIRMSEHLVKNPDADVPITAGVRWLAHAKAGNLPGDVAGLAAIEFPALNKACLFAGSTSGDRLFRAKGEDAFEEITAAARLATKSRCFAWLDVDGDGLADLVSWDGSAAAVRLACADGTFKPGAAAPAVGSDCLALAPCSINGRPGLLVSTSAAPFLLMADEKGEWKRVELPPAAQPGNGQPSACVVADLDNDGFVDILQPYENTGVLWRGMAGGLLPPQPSPVATGGGRASAAVGDFNQDGFLDIFLAGAEKNTLWENDDKGGFRDVFRYSGSMSYKCPTGAAAVATMDLNHDGRQDICLGYAEGEPLYHWNRGFRSFGEEGEVRLPAAQGGAQVRPGQRALLAADLNGDGSLDLATILSNGDLLVCFTDQVGVPGVRLRLRKGTTGPVTASVWIGDKHPECLGALPVPGHSPAAFLCTRYPGKCTVQFHLPGQPNQSVTVAVEDAPKDVILKETAR